MQRSWAMAFGGLIASATLAVGCTPECTFAARCDGDVLETCHVGVDQMVGSPISRHVCEAPNPRCVQAADDVALCVTAAAAACDSGYTPACQNDAATKCTSGFVVATDCSLHGPSCVLTTTEAVCAVEPLTSCDAQTHVAQCAGNTVLRCRDGYVQAEVCDAYVPPRHCGENNGHMWCLE